MSQPFQVWKDIYAIGGPDISEPSDCCIYMIDAGELVLIDSGAGDSFNQLIGNIKALGFEPQRLKAVVVTHAHIDHIGALADFQQKYGVQLIAHELDAPAIETGKGTGAEAYGVPYQPCKIDVRISNIAIFNLIIPIVQRGIGAVNLNGCSRPCLYRFGSVVIFNNKMARIDSFMDKGKV